MPIVMATEEDKAAESMKAVNMLLSSRIGNEGCMPLTGK